jgi:hypothetical protein
MSASEPKKKRFAARPLLVAGAGLTVIALGATSQAYAAGNLMAHRPCKANTAWNGKDCVPVSAPDAGVDNGPDAGLRKLTKDEPGGKDR